MKRYAPCATSMPRRTARPLPGRASCRITQLLVLASGCLGNLQRAIPAAVFDHQHLAAVGPAAHKIQHLLQGARQAPLLVMRGDDDGEKNA